jgi:hypothetical protein
MVNAYHILDGKHRGRLSKNMMPSSSGYTGKEEAGIPNETLGSTYKITQSNCRKDNNPNQGKK